MATDELLKQALLHIRM